MAVDGAPLVEAQVIFEATVNDHPFHEDDMTMWIVDSCCTCLP